MVGFGTVLVMLIIGTYLLARIATIAEESKLEKRKQLQKLARQRSVDALYGRSTGEEDESR